MNYPNGYDPMNFSQSPQQNTNSFQPNLQSQLYYANQLAQQQAAQRQQQALQQTQHQQQYGGGSLAATGGVGGGSMMRGTMPQQQMGAHQSPYSGAPYVQGVPPTTFPTSVPQQHQHQQQPQQQQQPQFGTISPKRDSPRTPQQQTSQMSAPTPSQQQQNQAQNQSQQGSTEQRPPLSPSQLQREKERVTLLLEINRELLQEVVNLQASGKAGMPGQPPGQTTSQEKETKDEKDGTDGQQTKPVPDKAYLECMRRLQANLAYLAAMADRSHKPGPIPTFPAIMIAPTEMPSLSEPYRKLLALFPGAKPMNMPQQQQGQRLAMPPPSAATQQASLTSVMGQSTAQGVGQPGSRQ
ncbi:hypothetical protein FGG08_006945 [Glutinoglossum americanum]|uniref:Uncharacterized protein n=1 Tax=Glutinoglossum americanum TaxID=1670608 RepID=A0A9P8I4A6_9PEZI|nr:hypothetical protein FGG08_006945 [Glutinoglossum americanum]